jgi:very-short-patch-repair endonuclease
MQNRHRVLAAYAYQQRMSPTSSELVLWRALRSSQQGVAFRRQVVLCERFIADFFAPEARLVIEVDGGYHARRSAADASRERKLARAGYRVLRLPAELVLRELPVALALVQGALTRSTP